MLKKRIYMLFAVLPTALLAWGVISKLQARQSIPGPWQQTQATISMLLVRTEHAGLEACLGMITQTLLRLLRIIAAMAKIAQCGFLLTYICRAVQTVPLLLPAPPSPRHLSHSRWRLEGMEVPVGHALEASLPVPFAQGGKAAAIPKPQ